MIYICNPSKISIYINTNKKSMLQIKEETKCTALINGGLFDMSTFTPVCHLKVDGKVLAKDKWKYWGFAWNNNKLQLVSDYSEFKNYIACVCLVRNGKAEPLSYPSDMGGNRARTAIGVFEDGRVWLYAVTSPKQSPESLQNIALQAGVKHCIMLDGGGSTQGVSPTDTIKASRKVHNYICVWEDIDNVSKNDNSNLVNYTKLSPNKTSPRNHKIDTITIHCLVAQWTSKQAVDYFSKSSIKAAPNYVVGKDGSIGLCVEEKDRSWCSSNSQNDHRAITIEVASDTTHPYAVTNKAYNALIELLVDICKRNGIKELKWKADKSLIGQVDKQNMTVHRWFKNKECPGDYLYSRHGKIADQVNKKLNDDLLAVTWEDKSVTLELPVLKKGSSGDSVKALQMLLNGNGCSCGSVDGSFGPATLSAVKKFQTNNKLSVDGIVGQNTWTALLT